jgi:hypothetical protein
MASHRQLHHWPHDQLVSRSYHNNSIAGDCQLWHRQRPRFSLSVTPKFPTSVPRSGGTPGTGV